MPEAAAIDTFFGEWNDFQAPKYSLYLVGDAVTAAGWNPAAAIEIPFDTEHPYQYVYEGEFVETGQASFRFLTQRAWAGQQLRPLIQSGSPFLPDVAFYTGGNDYSWKIPAGQAGRYRITINLAPLSFECVKL
jgi:hypothetical protein